MEDVENNVKCMARKSVSDFFVLTIRNLEGRSWIDTKSMDVSNE